MTEEGFRLKDKVIIITGGAQGIGRAYAFGTAEEGARVVVADINLEAAQITAREIEAKRRCDAEQAAELQIRSVQARDAAKRSKLSRLTPARIVALLGAILAFTAAFGLGGHASL